MSLTEQAELRRDALTTRQRAIIQQLTMTVSRPITVSAIAEKLSVSTRTILREMPAVEKWFAENDFRFSRKPGVGLLLEENEETAGLIRELLEVEVVQHSYSKQERQRRILGELLSARGPVKSYAFTSLFHISEGTLSNDLDDLGQWLREHRLSVIRRPGIGIYLEGTEADLRQAIASAAFDFIDEEQILNMLRRDDSAAVPARTVNSAQERLLSFIDGNTVEFVERVLQNSEKHLHIKYTDSAYMALVVHLSLAIRRIKSGEQVTMDPEELAALRRAPEFSVAEEIINAIGAQLHLDIPVDEAGYITMHLCSARIWPRAISAETQMQTLNARQVVMSIVGIAEQELNLGLRDCDGMIEELISHMDAMISRLTMNIHVGNSQIEAIRQNYPDIYAASERACGILKDLLHIDEVPASEITYVAMHFAAAAEKLRSAQEQVRVVVVCPTGVGASRMLAANLMKEFQNIEIHQVISAFGIEPETLREEGVDLIMSTVALQVDFPTLVVSPILQAQDKVMIRSAVEALSRQRKEHRNAQQRSELRLEDIRQLSVIGGEISELLNAFYVFPLWYIRSIDELVERASGLFARNLEQKTAIGEALLAREDMGPTYIPEMGIYLMHCMTDAVEHCRAAYIRLQTPLRAPEGKVKGAMLLLLPKREEQELYAQVIGRVSILLVEDPSFLATLQDGEAPAGRKVLERALVRWYQNEYSRRRGH